MVCNLDYHWSDFFHELGFEAHCPDARGLALEVVITARAALKT